MFSRIKLAWQTRKVLVPATLMVGVLRVALACLPYRTVRRVVDRTSAWTTTHVIDVSGYQAQLVWAVHTAGRYLLGDKPCLPEALAVQWFLRRRGIEATLNIGVRKHPEEGFSAHAWVEQGGAVLIGGDMSQVDFKRMNTIKS